MERAGARARVLSLSLSLSDTHQKMTVNKKTHPPLNDHDTAPKRAISAAKEHTKHIQKRCGRIACTRIQKTEQRSNPVFNRLNI